MWEVVGVPKRMLTLIEDELEWIFSHLSALSVDVYSLHSDVWNRLNDPLLIFIVGVSLSLSLSHRVGKHKTSSWQRQMQVSVLLLKGKKHEPSAFCHAIDDVEWIGADIMLLFLRHG